jgi:formylmethanofuran dehydrogenase subunit E
MSCPDHPDIERAMRTGYPRREEREREPVYICSECCETIYAGERYLDVFGEQFCQDCYPQMIKKAEAV